MKKLKKILMLVGATTAMISSAFALSACSNPKEEAVNNLNEEMKIVLDAEIGFAGEKYGLESNVNVENYHFLGSSIEPENDEVYSVDIYGLAKYDSESSFSYTDANYKVSKTYFEGINSNSSSTDVVNALIEVVKNEVLNHFETVVVNEIKNVNSAVSNNIQKPLDDFKIDSALVYSISKPSFNEEKGYVSFSTKTFLNMSKTEVKVTYGPIYKFDGEISYGPVTTTQTVYNNFDQTDEIFVRATPEEMQAMKEDNSLVFKKFVELVNNKDRNNYEIQTKSTTSTTLLDAPMTTDINLGKIENELGK